MSIPFLDLGAEFASLRPELDAVLADIIDSLQFIQGRHVKAFEAEFAAALSAPFVVGCSNGTSALELALEAVGVQPGDEVITTAHTFIATAEAIVACGATPVFADIDPLSHTLCPKSVAALLTPRTRALVPVHIYGTPCDMTALMALAQQHGLAVVEDAAQAHLARWEGRYAGTIGDAGTFSFYPGKNLGAMGDAGAVVTGRADVEASIRRVRDHGRSSKYLHEIVGRNERMDEIQAAVLRLKLPRLEQRNALRRQHRDQYRQRLAAAGFQMPSHDDRAVPAVHLCVVECANRDEVLEALKVGGIGAGVHYPVPLHLQPAMRHLGGGEGSLPVTERVAQRVLSLPIFPEMTDEQITAVVSAFLAVARP